MKLQFVTDGTNKHAKSHVCCLNKLIVNAIVTKYVQTVVNLTNYFLLFMILVLEIHEFDCCESYNYVFHYYHVHIFTMVC